MFVQDCLPCRLAKTSASFSTPWGQHVRAQARNEVVHFDYVYIGPSDSGEEYLLVIARTPIASVGCDRGIDEADCAIWSTKAIDVRPRDAL